MEGGRCDIGSNMYFQVQLYFVLPSDILKSVDSRLCRGRARHTEVPYGQLRDAVRL